VAELAHRDAPRRRECRDFRATHHENDRFAFAAEPRGRAPRFPSYPGVPGVLSLANAQHRPFQAWAVAELIRLERGCSPDEREKEPAA